MRAPQAALSLRRIGSARLVLAAVLATTVVVAALAATLAALAGQALPQAAERKLAAAPDTSIAISAPLDAAQAATDTAAIRSALRTAFGAIPRTLYRSLWSDSLGLPTRYGAAQVPLMRAASPDAIMVKAALVRGTWPGAPVGGQPIPAAIPSAVASELRLSVNGVVAVSDRDSGASVRLRIVGVFRPRNPRDEYWNLDLIGTGGAQPVGGFITYGPAVVNPAAFSRGYLAVGYASWLAAPQVARISTGQLQALAANLTRLESSLRQSPQLGGLQVTSGLPGILSGIAANLRLARSLLAVGALLLFIVAAAAVLLASHLLADQRGSESALLRARGGSRWQLARLNAAEALPIACIAAAGGALLGSLAAALTSRAGPLHNAGLRISGVPAGAWWAATAAALACALPLLGSALHIRTPGVARQRRGRQAAVAGIARAGGDVALIALAVLAVWQLRRYATVTLDTAGGIGVDPVLATAPAFALVGGTVVLMRLLRPAARAADRAASWGKKLLAVLATWEFSRRPVRRGAPALIGVLAVATGTLVLAQLESAQRSARDQAAFTTGADVRVETTAPVPLARAADIAQAPGAADAMPVARVTYESTGVLLAVDTRKAAATVTLRRDLSRLSPASLWKPLIPRSADGIAVPGRPERLGIAASLGPAADGLGEAGVSAAVQDATGVAYAVPFGTLAADGRRHVLVASLAPGRRAAYPLRLLAISLTYEMPPSKAATAVLTVGAIAASDAAAGPLGAPFDLGRALRTWSATASSPALTMAAGAGSLPSNTSSSAPVAAGWRTAASGAQSLAFDPGHALLPPGPSAPLSPPARLPALVALTARRPGTPTIAAIPGIATQAYLDATRTAVGVTVPAVVNDVTVPVRITAKLAAFPTVTGPGGAVIVDQATLQDVLAAQSAGPVGVTEWWLHTRHGPSGLPAGTTVTRRASVAAALLGNPLTTVPQQALLVVALAAAMLAAVGFTVSVAANVVECRSQDALLAALGVSRAARARLLCLEEVMLSLPSAAAGLLLGSVLARLIIPASTLTAAARAPVPPVLTEVPLAHAAAIAAAVAAVPVLAAATAVARRRDPAAQLRATEPG